MTLSYNLAYQEIILVHHTLQGVRFLLANHTLLSGTSETLSYIDYTLYKDHPVPVPVRIC